MRGSFTAMRRSFMSDRTLAEARTIRATSAHSVAAEQREIAEFNGPD
jgi:hypothetical protein